MSVPYLAEFDDGRGGLLDVPLILEDLLCQVEDLRAIGGDPGVVAELWAQVHLLEGR